MREGEKQTDCDEGFYARNRYAEADIGLNTLRWELGLSAEHRTSPCNCLFCIRQAEDGHSFRGNVQKYTFVFGSKTIRSNWATPAPGPRSQRHNAQFGRNYLAENGLK